MLEAIFLTVNEWMVSGTAIAGVGCFTWGMISVLFSPCHLASIPLVAAYVGGQDQTLNPKQAGVYSSLFALGLFISIALIGIVCALLGRMLGDVGNFWQIFVGVILIWVALGILGVEKCSVSGSLLYRLNLKGLSGAFLLGHNHPAKSYHRHSVYSSVCHGTLLPPCISRQFDCHHSKINGKQRLARSRHLVSARGRCSNCSIGCVFYN